MSLSCAVVHTMTLHACVHIKCGASGPAAPPRRRRPLRRHRSPRLWARRPGPLALVCTPCCKLGPACSRSLLNRRLIEDLNDKWVPLRVSRGTSVCVKIWNDTWCMEGVCVYIYIYRYTYMYVSVLSLTLFISDFFGLLSRRPSASSASRSHGLVARMASCRGGRRLCRSGLRLLIS